MRTLRPDAVSATVITGKTRTEMTRVHDGGVFEAVLDGPAGDYRVEVGYAAGSFVQSTTRTAGCPRSARSTCT